MAELIDACENGHDHDQDSVKVVGPFTGQVLSTGYYFRLRNIHRESSFSVVG